MISITDLEACFWYSSDGLLLYDMYKMKAQDKGGNDEAR